MHVPMYAHEYTHAQTYTLENSHFHFDCLIGLVFLDNVSLSSPDCPGTHSLDKVDLELRDPPASASMMGRKSLSGYTSCFQTGSQLWIVIGLNPRRPSA